MNKKVLIITIIIIITIIMIIFRNQEKKPENNLVISPVTSTPIVSPTPIDLKKELESVDPKVLDSDFNE